MGRVSATFKRSTEGMVRAYADANGISFSEAIEIFASKGGLEWFSQLPKKDRDRLNREYNIFTTKNSVSSDTMQK